MSDQHRFAIVDVLSDGQERLLLYEMYSTTLVNLITGRIIFGDPAPIRARRVSEMNRVVGTGDFSQSGGTIEWYVWLKVSPSGRYVAAYSHEVGTFADRFHDHNIKIYDLSDGSLVESFNEHRFTANKSACHSQLFDDHLAELADLGHAPQDYALTDYRLDTAEAAIEAGGPELHWLSDDSFVVEQSLGVIIENSPSSVSVLAGETFNFTFSKTASGWSEPQSCNQHSGPYPPSPVSTVRVGSPDTTADRDKVHYRAKLLAQYRYFWKPRQPNAWLPLLFRNDNRIASLFNLPKFTAKPAKLAEGRPIPRAGLGRL